MVEGTKNRPIIAFTNGNGEAKKIDVQRSVDIMQNQTLLEESFSDTRDARDFIFACPRTPLAPISFSFFYEVGSTSSNFINKDGIQFSYQNVYRDGSVSSIAPYSDLAIAPSILSLGTASIGEKSIENVCTLTIPLQGDEVEFVNLIFREGNDGVPFLFDKVLNSEGSKNPNYTYIGGAVMGTYQFRNDKTGVVLSENDRFKTFDNVPREPHAQAVADDRVIYGNYKEGYDNVDVSATLSVELANAPAPGYSFDVSAYSFTFRKNENNDGGLRVLSNAGFVVDFSDCPTRILPGTYNLNVLYSPSQNFHIFSGVADKYSRLAIPENTSSLHSTSDFEDGEFPWPFGSGAFDTYDFHASQAGANSSLFNGEDSGKISWTSENGDSIPGHGPGQSPTAPIIVKGAPISFSYSIEVESETTRAVLEDSFAHAMCGLSFSNAPIALNGEGFIKSPATELEASNVEVEINVGLSPGESFPHDTSPLSDLICGFPGGGLFLINKAKMRFFIEPGKSCVGVGADGKVSFDEQFSISGGYGMKICLAHMTDVEVLTCIPTPQSGFGSYVSPTINPSDNSIYLPDLENQLPTPGLPYASHVRRTQLAATSVYDYYIDVNGSRRLCWPDQRRQFDPDLSNAEPDLYGPAGRSTLTNAFLGAYTRSVPEDWARRSEVPNFTQESDLAGSNTAFLPAPIGKWYVFDFLKNRFNDSDWARNYSLHLSYDVVGADNGNKTYEDLLIEGNPSTFFGDTSQNWVGEIANLNFTDGNDGRTYCRLGINRPYTKPTVNNLTDLNSAANQVNRLSLVDGTCGPGGLDGYAYRQFKQDSQTLWDFAGSSTDGYQGLSNVSDRSSGNTRGSVTNFHLAGFRGGMPFISGLGAHRRLINQTDSLGSPPILDSQFAQVVENQGAKDKGLWAYYNGFQNYEIPFRNDVYTYSENSDITSEFPPALIQSFTAIQFDNESVVNLFDPVFPEEPAPGIPNQHTINHRVVGEDPPLSAGSAGTIPSSSINTNIGVSGGFSFKSGATHEFGVVYFDERGRHGAVQPVGSVYVPGYSGQERQGGNLGGARVVLDIDSKPPDWARSYKIVYAGNTNVSEFVQYSTNGAFLEKDSETGVQRSRIYVSLNYLQGSEVSYAEAYGAVSQDDGTKSIYRFAPGDMLSILQYSTETGQVLTPARPTRFRVVDSVTLDPLMTDHPLFVTDGNAMNDVEKSGEFVILEDNSSAEGFSVADIEAGTSKWRNRVIFEIARPTSEISEVAKPYYETPYGGQVTVEGNHQYTRFTMTKGDVFFRQVPVNVNSTNTNGDYVSNISGPVEEPLRFRSNFVGYFLETRGATDLYRSDSKNYGRVHFADSSAAEYNRISSLMFSEKTFTGSSDINYFSFPQIGNFKDLPISNGEIQRLYSDNVSLTAYQTSKISALPVSRDVLQTGEEDVIVKSSKVLGTPTELKTSYSIYDNPESLVVVDGDHFFFDKRARKIIMLKGGKEAVAISDIRVDSYVERVTNQWLDDEWRAILGYDPNADELLFALVTNTDLNGDANSSLFGTLAFDMKTKKYWKTRYSYISQFFSKIGGKLLGGWTKTGEAQFYPYMFDTPSSERNRFFDADQSASTTFSCVLNKSPESVKEMVMLNAVSNKHIDVKLSTDQTEGDVSFKVWKDYDGVKYAEIPKKPASRTDLGRTQKSNWLPTYPALEDSAPGALVSIQFDPKSQSWNVLVSMVVPTSSAVWRSPIPTGSKTFLVEGTRGNLQQLYPCGAHPDSDVSFDRGVFIKDILKALDGSGVLQFGMPWRNFLDQDDGNGGWVSNVNPPSGVTDADFRAQLNSLISRLQNDFAWDPVENTFNGGTAPVNIDISDENLFSDQEIANLSRLFIVPILSCTSINENAAKKSYLGEVPRLDLAGDVNDDGQVSVADLLDLLGAFGQEQEEGSPLDPNADGFVTVNDILVVLSEFGQTEDTGTVIYGCTNPAATNFDPSANVDDGSCVLPDGGNGGDDGGSEPEPLNVWWLAAQSQNKQIYVGYSNVIDGVHMKGRYAKIDVTSTPSNDELNLESLMVDFNELNKNPGQGVLNRQRRRRK